MGFNRYDCEQSTDIEVDSTLLIVRAPAKELQKEQLAITKEDEVTSTLKLEESEKLTSNIVRVATYGNDPIKFKVIRYTSMYLYSVYHSLQS